MAAPFEWDVRFKAEHHPEGLIRVTAPDEAGARAHVLSMHSYDLSLHIEGVVNRSDMHALHANKIANPNMPGSPVIAGRDFTKVEIVSVTRVVPDYLAALKAEVARHEN